MTKPAGKIVSLTELRFKPANSNDAARAVVAHHFADVPHCAFAGDDGISPYLGSETGMEPFPDAPDSTPPVGTEIPAIRGETPEKNGSLHRKLLRGGFALSVFLHIALAVAVGLATLSIPDDAPLEEGITSVTIVTQGTSEVEARLAGDTEEVEAPLDKPVETQRKKVEKPAEAAEKPAVKPVTEEPVKIEDRPVETKTEDVPRDVPLPIPGAERPEVLTSQDSRTETEAIAKPPMAEEKIEPVEKPVTPVAVEKKPVEQKPVEKQPEEKPKPVEKKVEEKQEKPKKEETKREPPRKEEPKKEKPREKRRQDRGNQGNTTTNGTKGDVDAEDKGRASTSSKGASSNREIGNSARTNYKGLVNRKLSRAKGRLSAPAKGEVWVGFTILSDGSISGLAVTRSSGKAALDSIALKVVRNALPFPPIPTEAGKKSWKMTVPMTFRGG